MGSSPNGWATPKKNWASADVVSPTDLNRVEGNIDALDNGARTIDAAQAPTGNVGTLRQFLDWFANRIKVITGKTNWYDAPDITLATLAQHKSRHASGGSDALTPADIGAAPSSHTHTPSQISPQGAGSGLDADLLDGKQGAYYLGFAALNSQLTDVVRHRADNLGASPGATVTVVNVTGAGWILGGLVVAGRLYNESEDSLYVDISIDGGAAVRIPSVAYNISSTGTANHGWVWIPPCRYTTSIVITMFYYRGSDYSRATAIVWRKPD